MMATPISVAVLRELFRNLQAFHSLFESDGIDTITHEGESYTLADIDELFRQSQKILPKRQRESIAMCLYMNMKEVDVAEAMGVSSTNPVAMYATAGLKRLIGLVQMGQFPRFKDSYGTAASLGIPDLSIYDPSRPVRQRILSRKQMLRKGRINLSLDAPYETLCEECDLIIDIGMKVNVLVFPTAETPLFVHLDCDNIEVPTARFFDYMEVLQ